MGKCYEIDLLVEKEVIIEIKSSDGIITHIYGTDNYLFKIYNKKLGYLINFNVPLLKDGFKRVVNNFNLLRKLC